jgi:hypothetical protein
MAETQEMNAFEAYELIALAISSGIQTGVNSALDGLQTETGLAELFVDQEGPEAERLAAFDEAARQQIYEMFHSQFTGLDCKLTWHNSTQDKRYANTFAKIEALQGPLQFEVELQHTYPRRVGGLQ